MIVHVFPSADVLTIRPFRRTDDLATRRVFGRAVRIGAEGFYTEAERIAWWGRTATDDGAWTTAREAKPMWVAERRGDVVGFVDLTANAEVDMLFVDPDPIRARGSGGRCWTK